ncbi:DUF6193 family natural product biosynthesis protein [Streptomyces sp. NPDC007905]|uniref:DUF6193 family natural product biosynthesis protein n=1 Tax=Streptomyces sp. NPDC007905 TaxID=3364788 RepID=UPI0036E20CA2
MTEAQWHWLLNWPHVDNELVRVAYEEPRLRQLFPWVSMWELHFSRCTQYPWSWDVPYIRPQPGGVFKVEGPSRVAFIGEVYTAQAAVAMVADRLPPGCGPAVIGDRDALAATTAGSVRPTGQE